jgi:hypothetical protein
MVSSAHHGRQIREEAAMATIAFNLTPQREHVREGFKTFHTACHEMLDKFVSNRMRRAAAQARYGRKRQAQAVAARPLDTQ